HTNPNLMSPYESFNNQIGVRLSYLVQDEDRKHTKSLNLISYQGYRKRAQRETGFRLRDGKAGDNDPILNWDAMPAEWRERMIERFGQPVKEQLPLEMHFAIDALAQKFFEDYTHPDGTHLTPEQRRQYTMNASLLRAL